MIENILIKASGDVIDREEVLGFAKEKAKDNYTVLVCGAGTKIGEALKSQGYETSFDNHGRVTESFEERKIIEHTIKKDTITSDPINIG